MIEQIVIKKFKNGVAVYEHRDSETVIGLENASFFQFKKIDDYTRKYDGSVFEAVECIKKLLLEMDAKFVAENTPVAAPEEQQEVQA